MKKSSFFLLPLVLAMGFLSSCTSQSSSTTIQGTDTVIQSNSSPQAQVYGDTITLNNQSITISNSGTYTLDGVISDGQITIDVGEKIETTLNLSGVSVTNSGGPAIYIKSGKVTINLVAGSDNVLTDGSTYSDQTEDAPNSTLYALEDLTITGTGNLTITSNYNDAVTTKDDLKIESGNITVTSVDDGIRGKDSVTINGGTMNITSKGDSIKADNDTEGVIDINGGTITIDSGDDGIKAYSIITINGGNITVKNSYEGLESEKIVINDGVINVTSSDDGINVASSSETATEGRPTMGGTQTENSDIKLTINGGTVTVNASGDGLDANGSIEVNGGKIVVYGPTNNGNAALDYDATFKITGGEVVAFGSAGMAQNVSTISTQNAVLINLTASESAGSVFTIKDSSENIIYQGSSEKIYTSVLVSNSLLKVGETYTYSTTSGATGTFSVSSVATQVGAVSRMGGGMRGGFDGAAR